MIKLDLSGAVLDLTGQPLKDDGGAEVKFHHSVADVLSKSPKGDACKLYDLATRIFKTPVVDIDQADAETILAAVEAAPVIPLVKAPILRTIREQIEAAKRDARQAPTLAEEPPTIEEAENRRRIKK